MKSISGKDFIKLLEKRGWILKRINGSHFIYTQPQKTEIISVPVHKNEDLKRGLLHKLMDFSNMSENEL